MKITLKPGKSDEFSATDFKAAFTAKSLTAKWDDEESDRGKNLFTALTTATTKGSKQGVNIQNLVKTVKKEMTGIPGSDDDSPTLDVYVGTTISVKGVALKFTGAPTAATSGPKVIFNGTKVEKLCKADKNVLLKIQSIMNGSDKGHGAVKNLGGANHAHVTNGDGIAFKWKGKDLVIVGYGVKGENLPAGNCGYTWEVN